MSKPVERIITNAEGEEERIHFCGEVDATGADPADWRIPPERLERIARNVEELRRRHDYLLDENRRLKDGLHRERLARLKLEQHSRSQSIELLAYHRDDVWRRMVSELPEDWSAEDVIGR